MYQLKKIFKFEMAHVLENSYSKECQHFHGHSYTLEVIVGSNTLDKNGVVIDFKKLKEIVQPVVNNLDHTCLVHSDKVIKEGVSQSLGKHGICFVDYNPTAENMAKYIYDDIVEKLEKLNKKFIIRVNLWETETGCVSYWDHTERFV